MQKTSAALHGKGSSYEKINMCLSAALSNLANFLLRKLGGSLRLALKIGCGYKRANNTDCADKFARRNFDANCRNYTKTSAKANN